MQLMRPVIDFLNRLKDEKQNKEDPEQKGPLETLVDAAQSVPVEEAETRSVFTLPVVKAAPKPTGPVMQKIQYEVPFDKVLEVKKVLGAASYKDVGIGTFEYFYNAEVD